MVWEVNGTPETLGSDTDDLTVSDLTAKKFNVFLTHCMGNGNIGMRIRAEGDTGATVYADRTAVNGGADTERSPNGDGWITAEVNLANNADDKFIMGYFVSIPGEEKMFIGFNCDRHDAGASAIPERVEFVGKYVPSPDSDIESLTIHNTGTGDFTTPSNLSLFGTD